MKNFIQHKFSIIENFCSAFKKDAFRNIWGIDLNCNVKSLEDVWASKQILDYQLLSKDVCVSGCTAQNPSFLIVDYPSTTGNTPFPVITCFNPFVGFNLSQSQGFSCGTCHTKVQVTPGSIVKTYNLTVCDPLVTTCFNAPLNNTSSFIYIPLIGYSIQLSLSGYGFLTPGTNYIFNSSTGEIKLLGGLLFNTSEVYTIFAYS